MNLTSPFSLVLVTITALAFLGLPIGHSMIAGSIYLVTSRAAELRSAGGTPFAGDFVVASRVGDRLEVAVVDVSGKGQGAGTRALLLSGALGGLLSALPPSVLILLTA